MQQGKAKTIAISTTTKGGAYTDIPELADEGNEYPAVEDSALGLLGGAETSRDAKLAGTIMMLAVNNAIVATLKTAQKAGTRVWFKYTSFDGLMVSTYGGQLGCLMRHAAVKGFSGGKSMFVVIFSAGASDESQVLEGVLARAVAAWRVAAYSGSGPLLDLSGNGHDAAFPGGANDPTFLAYAGTQYMYLPGVDGNDASTPDSPALGITGDIDIRVRLALDDWSPATVVNLMNSWAPTPRGCGGLGMTAKYDSGTETQQMQSSMPFLLLRCP